MKTLEKYLERTSKNLYEYVYQDKNNQITKRTGIFFKVIPFEKDGKKYFATVEIREDKVYVRVRKVESYKRISINNKEYISPYLRRSILFHSYGNSRKKVSVKHFKKINNLIMMVESLLISKYDPSDNNHFTIRKNNEKISSIINDRLNYLNMFSKIYDKG